LPPILALTTEPITQAASVQWKLRVGKSHTRTGVGGGVITALMAESVGRAAPSFDTVKITASGLALARRREISSPRE
jgi:hypothetical protein